MKILHVCAIGGTAQLLLKPQIDYLLSEQLEVEIACSLDSEAEALRKEGYVVHPIQIERKISLFSNLVSIYQLTNLIRQQQYDLVHVHTPIASVLGRIAAKIAGVKRIVYTAHGFPFHDSSSSIEYFLYFNVEKLVASFTDLILTQNHEDIATAKRLALCTPEKMGYLGNGVDIKRFKREQLNLPYQNQLRQSLGIPETADIIIGFIGRLIPTKGSGYLIDAVAKLIDDFPNLHLLIIAPKLTINKESFQAELIDKIEALELSENVSITGERQDIPELLGLLDIFVLPTFAHEGLPRSILEAMAMSLPIVTTDIRGCREAVLNEKNGLIVPPKNSEVLADALSKLLSNPELRQVYGRASRERLETEYNEEFVFHRLIEYYKKLGITYADN